MVSVVLVSWAGCNRHLAVALICIAVGASGATFCGFHCAFQVGIEPNLCFVVIRIQSTQ